MGRRQVGRQAYATSSRNLAFVHARLASLLGLYLPILPPIFTTPPFMRRQHSAPLPPSAGAFRLWCQEQMRELTGRPDVTLCEFLLTVESNSELAEYCTLYLGSSPGVSWRGEGVGAEPVGRWPGQAWGGASAGFGIGKKGCGLDAAVLPSAKVPRLGTWGFAPRDGSKLAACSAAGARI